MSRQQRLQVNKREAVRRAVEDLSVVLAAAECGARTVGGERRTCEVTRKAPKYTGFTAAIDVAGGGEREV